MAEEVQRVNSLLVDTVDSLCVDVQVEQQQQQERTSQTLTQPLDEEEDITSAHLALLNAADYLYVSTRLAKAFPQLVESMIVQSYRSYLPGEISKKWLDSASASSLSTPFTSLASRPNVMGRIGLTSWLILGLQRMGTAPFLLQRLLVRFTQPLFLTVLITLWYALQGRYMLVYVSLLGGGILLAGVALWYRYRQDIGASEQKSSRVKPVWGLDVEKRGIEKKENEKEKEQEHIREKEEERHIREKEKEKPLPVSRTSPPSSDSDDDQSPSDNSSTCYDSISLSSSLDDHGSPSSDASSSWSEDSD